MSLWFLLTKRLDSNKFLLKSFRMPQAPQAFGEKMQTEGYYFPLHYEKGTSTNDMYVQSPATCQSIGVNTGNPTSGGIIKNLLDDSLNRVKVLNAQQMMKRRKEMDINFM